MAFHQLDSKGLLTQPHGLPCYSTYLILQTALTAKATPLKDRSREWIVKLADSRPVYSHGNPNFCNASWMASFLYVNIIVRYETDQLHDTVTEALT